MATTLCPGAQDSCELFGHLSENGSWKDGLVPCLLRRLITHSRAETAYAKSYDDKRNKSQLPQPKKVQVGRLLFAFV